MYIFRTLLFLLLLSFGNASVGQNLLFKDGVSLGDRQEFIASCIQAANDSLFNYGGILVETEVYCNCVSDHLIPTIHSTEFFKAVEDNVVSEFLLREDNQEFLIGCFATNTKRLEAKVLILEWLLKAFKEDVVSDCMEGLKEKESLQDVFTEEMMTEFCECRHEKILAAELEGRKVGNINDKDGVAYHEIVLPCFFSVNKQTAGSTLKPPNKPEDIILGGDSCKVSLFNYMGTSYKVKMSIGGITKYYLFDTGATDIMISQEMEQELLASGALKKENYLYKTEIIAAGDLRVPSQIAIVDNVVIGDYTVNNVIVSIVPGGPPVCGLGFLAKFGNWEFNKQKSEIVLYR